MLTQAVTEMRTRGDAQLNHPVVASCLAAICNPEVQSLAPFGREGMHRILESPLGRNLLRDLIADPGKYGMDGTVLLWRLHILIKEFQGKASLMLPVGGFVPSLTGGGAYRLTDGSRFLFLMGFCILNQMAHVYYY